MANNIGTLVGAPIRPFAEESVFAAAYADELQGGLHIVQTDASRNEMPSWYLQDGMVTVVLTSAEAGNALATYQYDSTANPSWGTFAGGGGSAAVSGAANGLQILSDGSIGLGGILTESETVIDASDNALSIGTGDFQAKNVEYSHFYISPNEVFMEYQAPSGDIGAHIGVGSGGEFSLAFNNSFIYDSGDGKGLVYGDDYSSTFDANSLITKAFAESLVDEVSTRIFNAEGDIASLDASIVRIDGSIVNIYDYQAIQDASILALEAATPNVANGLQILSDGSIGLGGQLLESTTIDASDYVFWVGAGDFQGGNQEYSSISISSSQVYMDSGDPTAQVYIRLDSTGRFELNFNNSEIIDNGDGKGLVYSQDYSATFDDRSLVDKAYVDSKNTTQDASIIKLDSSVNSLINEFEFFDASIDIASWVNTSTYYDGSLAQRDTSIAWLNTNKTNKNAAISYQTTNYELGAGDNGGIIEASGNITITLPNSMATGYQAVIVRVGGGDTSVNIEASGTLFSKDSSTHLRNQWAGATVYHRGSNQWVAMGDLN